MTTQFTCIYDKRIKKLNNNLNNLYYQLKTLIYPFQNFLLKKRNNIPKSSKKTPLL